MTVIVRRLRLPSRCVFCLRVIRARQVALDRGNGFREHLACLVMEKTYQGPYGTLERDEGMPRCHICGWHRDFLARHALLAHGLSVDAYREQFGLNRTTPLCSYSFSQFHAALGLANQQAGKFPSGEEGKGFLPHPSWHSSAHERRTEGEVRRLKALRLSISGDRNPMKDPAVRARAIAARKRQEPARAALKPADGPPSA